jgi:hypothetical protein
LASAGPQIDREVDVTGQTREAVQDHCDAANHDVADVCPVERVEERCEFSL